MFPGHGELRAADALLESHDLFVAGADDIQHYRIPSLVTTVHGTLLAVCDGAVATAFDAISNTDLVLKRSSDRGRSWEPMRIISDPGDGAVADQCMVVDRQTDTVWIFYDYLDGKVSADLRRRREDRKITLHAMFSRDDGRTWSRPARFGEAVMHPEWESLMIAPGRGVQTRKGRLLLPCYSRQTDHDYSHVMSSADHGRTWQISAGTAPQTNECQVVELAGGAWMLNMRNASKTKSRTVATSADEGKTWRVIQDQNLPGPGCQAALARYTDLRDGYTRNRLLFANPASPSRREKMTVRLSYDEARTWPVAKLLDGGTAGYSCLTILDDGTIGILYESHHPKASLTFSRFNLEWLTDGEDSLQR